MNKNPIEKIIEDFEHSVQKDSFNDDYYYIRSYIDIEYCKKTKFTPYTFILYMIDLSINIWKDKLFNIEKYKGYILFNNKIVTSTGNTCKVLYAIHLGATLCPLCINSELINSKRPCLSCPVSFKLGLPDTECACKYTPFVEVQKAIEEHSMPDLLKSVKDEVDFLTSVKEHWIKEGNNILKKIQLNKENSK